MTAAGCWALLGAAWIVACTLIWAFVHGADEPWCVCGHDLSLHQHYRNGSDCGVCGRNVCARFVAADRSVDVVRARSADLPDDRSVITEHDRDWDAAFHRIVEGEWSA